MNIKKCISVVLLFGVVLLSCKRVNDDIAFTDSTIQKTTDVFLNKKIGSGQGIAANIAKEIKENLQYSKAWVNDYTNGEQIITIPIGAGYQFKNNTNKNPNNYLVLFKDVTGVVRSGYIWQALSGATVTKNTFANIYNHLDADLNGAYAMLDLKDNFMYQRKYENNKEKEFWIRQIEPSTNTTNNTGVMVCTDYYVLHTTYNTETGEILNQEVSYTFQVCNCTPSDMVQSTIIGPGECDPNGDGSGGGQDPCDAIAPQFHDETNYTQTAATNNVDVANTTPGEEKPFQFTWTVCEGATWKVESIISGIYKRYFVPGLPTFLVHVRDVIVTPGTYSGSQIISKTTWHPGTNVATVLNQDTHTAKAYGVVSGRLHHVCTIFGNVLNPALCAGLNRWDNAMNNVTVSFN